MMPPTQCHWTCLVNGGDFFKENDAFACFSSLELFYLPGIILDFTLQLHTDTMITIKGMPTALQGLQCSVIKATVCCQALGLTVLRLLEGGCSYCNVLEEFYCERLKSQSGKVGFFFLQERHAQCSNSLYFLHHRISFQFSLAFPLCFLLYKCPHVGKKSFCLSACTQTHSHRYSATPRCFV